MGKFKGQKVAAIGDVGSLDKETMKEDGEESEKEGIVATTSATLTLLLDQQKALADQILALQEQDF